MHARPNSPKTSTEQGILVRMKIRRTEIGVRRCRDSRGASAGTWPRRRASELVTKIYLIARTTNQLWSSVKGPHSGGSKLDRNLINRIAPRVSKWTGIILSDPDKAFHWADGPKGEKFTLQGGVEGEKFAHCQCLPHSAPGPKERILWISPTLRRK